MLINNNREVHILPNKHVVSVVVVNWNGRHHLQVCLTSLLNQTYKPLEIILVDNGSTDGSINFVKESYPTIKTIALEENRGFCGGNNVGIQQASGEFIALINNDTEAEPRWIDEAVKALIHNTDVGFIASRICFYQQRDVIDTVGDYFFRTGYAARRGRNCRFGQEFSNYEWVFGACGAGVVYRREMLEQIGLFDESFFAYYEDVDLSLRAQIAGYRCLYVPNAVVFHKAGATTGINSPWPQYWSHRNHWFVLLKNLPIILLIKYLPQILFAEMVVFGNSIIQHRVKKFFLARFEVISQLRYILRKRKEINKIRRLKAKDIDLLIRKDWFSYRKKEKQREVKNK